MAAELERDDIDGALLDIAKEAAYRWEARTKPRKARQTALKAHKPLGADTPDRWAMRVNYLVNDVRRTSGGGLLPTNAVLRRLVERETPITAQEVSDEIVEEVVLGTRDFLSVEFLERGVAAARSVGRILIQSGGTVRARGTGFLVAPGLLLTNHHVLTSEALAATCSLQMDYEMNRFGPEKLPQIFALQPERFFLNDKEHDYALVAVAETNERAASLHSYGWLVLNGQQGKIAVHDKDYLNIVQHPDGREKEVVIRNNRVLDLTTAQDTGAKEMGPFLHYEADTEKGSSGSPVLNDGWEVVALHHSGVPDKDAQGRWLDKDGKVWREGQQPVEAIKWVANEAVRVSSLLASINNNKVKLDAAKQAFLTAAFAGQAQSPIALGERPAVVESADAPVVVADTPVPPRPPRAPSSSVSARPPRRPSAAPQRAQVATLEVPLRITVSLGAEPRATRVAVPERDEPDDTSGLAFEALHAEDFADREGYAPNFLGVPVPMPKVKAQPRFGGALIVPRPARPADKTVLRYHNYSIIMCERRRLAYVSACNVDFAAEATAGRKDGRTTWRIDPRLDGEQQLDRRFYDHNDYDKGHLTRRDDTAWGDDLDQAIAANDDTFFYPNAAPQHFKFNQSDDFTGAGLDLWGDLENHISKQGAEQRTRLTIFNGPIFGTKDKPLHEALVPLQFYKIVVWKDAGQKPGAAGFVLDQADLVASLPEEAIEADQFEIRQRRIADIEAMVDVEFGKVKDFDRLSVVNPNESGDGIVVASLDDVVL